MLWVRRCCTALFCGLLALGSGCVGQPALYAEYALATGVPAESVRCYDGCSRSSRAEFRAACFAHCDGVVATTTDQPCQRQGRTRCTWDPLAVAIEPEPPDEACESSDDSVALAVVGSVLNALVSVAEISQAERSERAERAHEAPKRPVPRVKARPRSKHGVDR